MEIIDKRNFKLCVIVLTLTICVFMNSCGSGVAYVPTICDYEAYLNKDSSETNSDSIQNKFSAYFDFSGVYTAYADSLTSLTFNGIAQKVTGSMDKYNVYTLANDSIVLEKDITSGQFFAKLKDSKQQGKLYAPLERTLKQILEKNQSALFVTDFEEYIPQNRLVYRQAYASSYFEQWIKRGKRITFFVTDYYEGNVKGKKSNKAEKLQGIKKHLYYAVFDDADEKLLKEVYAGLEGCPKNYKVFTLSNNSYSLTPDYKTTLQGGTYHDENGDDIVTASVEDGSDFGFKKICDKAELYTFAETWPNIVANAHSMQEEGVPVQFKHVFHNLFIDLSKFDSYSIDAMEVKVTEIEDDFRKFIGWSLTQKYPAKETTIEGEKVVEIPELSADYFNEDGTISGDYNYLKNKGNVFSVDNLLTFSQHCFDETKSKSNGNCAEIAIDLSPNATGIIPDSFGSLMRVDVVISKVTPKLGHPQQGDLLYDLFNWEGNDCLYMSIKNVLQHSSSEGRLLYTYFINYQK